jgi:glutamine amidotransferase
MIMIIDYGLGNLYALSNVYRRLNIPVGIAKCAADLCGASKLILPGVGAFDQAMRRFEQSGMHDAVAQLVLQHDIPLLGICVGMQMLACSSDEGSLPGLGWIAGAVRKMVSSNLQLPHMGWNDVKAVNQNPLFSGLEKEARFYFLHSYYFVCDHRENVLAVAAYGQSFTCAVKHKNIYGVQFHPEKSHHYGAQLLKNFAEL